MASAGATWPKILEKLRQKHQIHSQLEDQLRLELFQQGIAILLMQNCKNRLSLGQQSMNSKQSLSLYQGKHANAIKQECIMLLKEKKKQDPREMKERQRQI